jgi:hypothetical protein
MCADARTYCVPLQRLSALGWTSAPVGVQWCWRWLRWLHRDGDDVAIVCNFAEMRCKLYASLWATVHSTDAGETARHVVQFLANARRRASAASQLGEGRLLEWQIAVRIAPDLVVNVQCLLDYWVGSTCTQLLL